MIPASRATASTSPFGNVPALMRASVAGCMRTRPRATASRTVTALAETSTIRARPRAVGVALEDRDRIGEHGEHEPLLRMGGRLPMQVLEELRRENRLWHL